MSGTRARALRAVVASALKGAVLRQASSRDKYQFLDVPRRPEPAPDRAFRVLVTAPPHRSDLQTSDLFRVEFMIEIFHALAKGIEDRVCDDTEEVWWILETLQQLDPYIQLSTPAHLGVEVTDHNWITRISVVIEYRLDGAVFN